MILHFKKVSLVIFQKHKFAITYDEIIKESELLKLRKYTELVANAYKVRLGEMKVYESDLYKNISYINKFIEPKFMDLYQCSGDIQLI